MNAKRITRLNVVSLEDRSLAAVGLLGSVIDPGNVPIPTVTASLSQGILRVYGTYLPDQINIKQSTGVITVSGVQGYFPAAAVSRIEVKSFGGNDVIRLNSETMPGGQPILKPSIVEAGAGDDVVFGGYGADTLFGEAGNDLIIGGPGNDLIVGGAGKDSLLGGAGYDRIIADTADSYAYGQAGTDLVVFENQDPAVLVNYNAAAMKSALQMGLTGKSFSQSKNGEKVTISNIEVESVTIENGVTTLHLKAKMRYQKTTGFPQFSTTGTIKFTVQPKLSATFGESGLLAASIKLGNPEVTSVNINNIPNWLDNTSKVRDFLTHKLEQVSPIPCTQLLALFLNSGGSLGPVVAA